MLRRIAHRENDHNLTIESFDLLRGKVRPRREGQAINTAVQGKTVRQKVAGATIRIRDCFANSLPGAVSTFEFKPHRYAAGRTSARGIEDMCGNCAHGLSSFSNLSRVILRCSSAAMRNSLRGSFCKRAFRIRSISVEVLPVAQTMKMKPKRSSYC